MNDKAKEARREYKRQWAREHPENVKAYQQRYWEKVAAAKIRRKNGQQDTASAEEQAWRMASLKTQGRKGCKAPRINLAFTPENHEFIRVFARATGRTMTETVNDIIENFKSEIPKGSTSQLWDALQLSIFEGPEQNETFSQ